MKILIDPGHGPGNANKGPTTYWEYKGMWQLSIHLQKFLQQAGVTAHLTHNEDQDPSVDARGAMAKGYDFFISQHSNAYNGTVQGSECYYSVLQPQNKATAAKFSAQTAALMGHTDRGAKTRAGDGGLDYYGVIRAAVKAGCPRVFLMESGFHDNRVDESFLLQDSNLQKLAQTQGQIILDTLGVTDKPTLPPGHTPSPWAKEAWEWAFTKGLTDGTNPQGIPTREQMVQLLYNFSRQP